MNDPKSRTSSLLRQSTLGTPGTRLVGAFTQLPFLIRNLGSDPAPIFAEAEMAPSDLAQPSQRVPYENLIILLDAAARHTKCHHFGILAGNIWRLSDLGPLGEMMRNCRNVGMALEELVVFQHVNSEGASAFMLQKSDTVDLGYTFYVPVKKNTVQFYDAVMAAAVNFMRELCGEEWEPMAVLFPHSRPANLEPYRRHFRSTFVFDSAICALRFAPQELSRPIVAAREELYQIALQQLRRAGKMSIIDAASRTLRSSLLFGRCHRANVAQSLAMHERTLSRLLKAEGVTFQQLLNSVRFAVAKELLENSRLSYEQLAVALGYANTESFFRAFHKWTGMTPGAWRDGAH
jgi:AraC-like DNA-binding protein